MEYKHIIYQPGKVARVILNRPRYYNAQSRLMREEMDDAFAHAMEDDQCGCVVLSGAGKHFSTGHDISTPEEMADQEARGSRESRFARYKSMRFVNTEYCLKWRALPKPTIAMVHGYCIYGGWMFATCMDMLFASEDALFLPGHTQYFSAPWNMSPKRARELVFEHRFITAWEGYEYGAINRVYKPEVLEKETLAFAERVAENWLRNPFRVRTAKFSINHMEDTMGFTPTIEAAYQSFCVMEGLSKHEVTHPSKGGFAVTDVAFANFEATKPWLEALKKHRQRE